MWSATTYLCMKSNGLSLLTYWVCLYVFVFSRCTLDADDRLVCILLPLSSPSEPLTVARHWPRLSQCESRHYTARGDTRRGAEIVAVC